MRVLPWVLLLLACAPDRLPADSPCADLCRVLVEDCGYQAFPTFSSCQEGCLHADHEGADIEGELACVQEAACDTFAIVECEHAHGPR